MGGLPAREWGANGRNDTRARGPRGATRSARASRPLLAGRGAVGLARLFVRFVVTDHAAGGGAHQAVVAGVVAGDAADDRALDAALGRSGIDLREQRERAGRQHGQNQSHVALSFHDADDWFDTTTGASRFRSARPVLAGLTECRRARLIGDEYSGRSLDRWRIKVRLRSSAVPSSGARTSGCSPDAASISPT